MAAACDGSEKVPTSPGREGLAAVCGESEVVPTSSWGETLAVVCGVSKVVPTSPSADDSEIPKIDLDEEEQDSFWESTWKMFKEYCLQNPMTVVVSAVLSFGHTILKKFLMYSTE